MVVRPALSPEAMLLPTAMSGFMVLFAAGVCVDVCRPCFHKRPCRCPWSRLLPEFLLVWRTTLSTPYLLLLRRAGPCAVGLEELAPPLTWEV